MKRLAKAEKRKVPGLVGVVHLAALPGSPRAKQSLSEIARRAASEARLLESEGFEALIVENFGDVPFFKDRVPPVTVAAMAIVAAAVRDAVRIPLGINVLRNDARAALGIAQAVGAQFVRVNVLSGIAATDQGLIEGDAAEIMRMATGSVQVWADALVKHARTLSVEDMELAVEELAFRAAADAVIVTGATTGRAIELERLRVASHAAGDVPLYLGSGATPENIALFRPYLTGVIVGSSLRSGGRAGAVLEARRVRQFVKSWNAR